MAEIAISYTLVTPGGTIVFNDGVGDEYRLTNIGGLDGRPIRATVEDAPQTDGALIYPFFAGARHITPEGYLKIVSVSDEAAVLAARNAMEDALIAACASILRADGTFSFTRTGGALRSYTVRCDMPPIFTGERGPIKSFALGLVSAT